MLGPIDQTVQKIETRYRVKVKDYTFSTEKGWDPIIVQLNKQQLHTFLKKMIPKGNFNGVEYVINNDGSVLLRSREGNRIMELLSLVN